MADEFFDIIEKTTLEYLRGINYSVNTRRRDRVPEDRVGRSAQFRLIDSNLGNPETVLDVGCGQGITSLYLLWKHRFDHLTAIDKDELVLGLLEKYARKLGLSNKVSTYCKDLNSGLNGVMKSDLVLGLDILYGNSGSLFESRPDPEYPLILLFTGAPASVLYVKKVLPVLRDVTKNRIILARACDNTVYCDTPKKMERDLKEAGFASSESGKFRIDGSRFLDFCVGQL